MQTNYLKVLSLLYENLGNFVSGQKIAKDLRVSRVAVYKMIKKLMEKGYKIYRKKNLGYKLVEIPFFPQLLLKEKLEIVRDVYYYPKITSTMDVSKELIANNPKINYTLVIAQTQTKSKGRLQRKWLSPCGGIWFSLILKPEISSDKLFLLNYLFSLGVVNTLKDYGLDAKTKWPNDVLVGDKKICGILIETDAEIDKVNWCIVGVGINVNIKEEYFEKHKLQATSVFVELKKEVDLNEFLKKLFKNIDSLYKLMKLDYKQLISLWCKNSSTLGRKVEIITLNKKIVGEAIGVSEDTGSLLLKTYNGKIESISSGDCVHLR